MQSAAESINLRGGVKLHERKRVKEAFALLAQPAQPAQPPNGKKSKRREDYRLFLQHLNERCGSQPVVVSVVGVGQSVITSMKEHDRLRLPVEIQRHERDFTSPTLQALAEECRRQGKTGIRYENIRCLNKLDSLKKDAVEVLSNLSTQSRRPSLPKLSLTELPAIPLQVFGSQTSRVFELTLEDAQAIITSHQVTGRVLLMEPHSMQTLPFITISLSEELCRYFTAQRNRVR
ncbi:hypothetical protein P171DRAFT_279586 [Karstenula rhodostoma CBS 690.94]|uniref:Uncharacterized protein n=1 Tax=Karstenula rhodostoma CBS 690.94 TaxID=1392251 RepID=A0A9P4UCS1_9PLEO|nr:hypothetical protein P171DRAFT_279586 [Karstenula rhodostoma CBS 690.94]